MPDRFYTEELIHPDSRTDPATIATLLSMVATMHRLAAAMLVLLCCCCLFLATQQQQQLQPAAGGNRASPSCIPHERDALLAFKHGVTSDPGGVLSSWRRDGRHDEQDCCRWRGVRCSNRTGHVHELRLRSTFGPDLVGQISPSLLALDHLEHLDLSGNALAGPTGRLPEFLGSLKNLKYLNLSDMPFYGGVPPQLGNLSRLQYLDLSSWIGLPSMNSMDLSWLTHIPSIQYLNLNRVHLSTVADWPRVMNMLPSLRALHLSGCSLASANQSLPHLNLTNLEELDASWNPFHHPMVTSWFWNITSLRFLDLSYTSMYGQFPDALGDMTSLQVLDLSNDYCHYGYHDDDKNMRSMITNLKNLCNLEVLNLECTLYGDIAELFRNLPRCSPNKLQELDLGSNHLTGMLPRWIGQFMSLVVLNLRWNNLNGHVPYEIGKLSNLTHLDLSINKLDGTITEEHFASARSLQYIDLSYNALKIEISSDWQPPSTLEYVSFASCQMGPLFPGWLQWNVSIAYLDISSAGIADRLPQWFSDAFSNVWFMNISNNQLNGTLPADMGSMSLLQLYLSSNKLTGQIPMLPPNITWLDLSNNLLSGLTSHSAVGSANLESLSLFSNRLTGHIPESFCKYQQLVVLDLSSIFLEGEPPLCLGVTEYMEFVALSNNSLSGKFPSSMQNLTNVHFLDLSWNKFSGRLPMWIGSLTSLRVIRLSHNKFFGSIPMNITNLSRLQYMDLNNNKISGSLPIYLSNLKFMTNVYMMGCYDGHDGIDSHLNSLSMAWKGQELNYGSIQRIVETCMMSIDLSSNNITGQITEEIVALVGLVNLNLSRNHLTGVIPKKIGEMRSLQSLDLSRNMLSGEIPATLSNLTFLSYLELSYNDLTGRIPSGVQLDTLYAEYPSMYIGNIGLCGHPLQNNCSSERHAPKQGGLGRTEEGYGIPFFYLGLGCGFVVGTWIAFGVLLFKRNWRIACFRLSDKLYDKVYVLVATWARARQTQTD
ncbi:receptor-like protein EIX2 [Miscanthus floridulus]|uniref:receptor-like protein EIX2 n=1 Tax=Miscanthus floridulus TaxID=154761 RepID=UPI00345B4091